jgi:hypothetical protein
MDEKEKHDEETSQADPGHAQSHHDDIAKCTEHCRASRSVRYVYVSARVAIVCGFILNRTSWVLRNMHTTGAGRAKM